VRKRDLDGALIEVSGSVLSYTFGIILASLVDR
jgi:hypothetical protein